MNTVISILVIVMLTLFKYLITSKKTRNMAVGL